MRKKTWIIATAVFVIALFVILWNAPRILSMTFEQATRILETRLVKETPPEYEARIHKDFNEFISAFKENKLEKANLAKLSEQMKTANEDKKFTPEEIDEILELIETITPGLK